MPELPDLTIYARNLRKQVLGRNIVSADIFNRTKVNSTPEMFRKALVGTSIAEIDRDGKELFFTMENRKVFSVHLMLKGNFQLIPYLDAHAINRKVIAIGFDGGEALILSDPLGMCKVTMNPIKPRVPDALSDDFTYIYFTRLIRLKATANIKSFLIDQQVVRGIGNAYADEILYAADISPKSVAGKIPPDRLQALYDAIPAVLEDAIAQITRISPDIIAGEERSFLKVHVPKREKAEDGEQIICEEVMRKRTYYTTGQKLYV